MAKGRQRDLRLIFDEDASTNVAKALACLGKHVTYVGAPNQVKKSTEDRGVARWAKQRGYVVFTFNFDMVLAASEEDVRFIWFDQRKRNLNKLETALILLKQWDKWEKELANPSVRCLKVGRNSIERLNPRQARQRALRRFTRSQDITRRILVEKDESQGRLKFEDDE